MLTTVVSARLAPADEAEVRTLIAALEVEDGYRPISDQAWIDLSSTGDGGAVRVRMLDDAGTLVAYMQADATAAAHGLGMHWAVESAIRADHRIETNTIAARLLASTTGAVHDAGGGDLTWVVLGPSPMHNVVAADAGLTPARRIHQMRRGLPTGLAFDVETRPFDPERDIDDWVRVNERAFAWNPEQGGWTADSVKARMREPWFDADGFLIHERDGRMAGFCWTKVHAVSEPPMGEIYVIAVDPDFHGLGLGRDLTLAGLDSLERRDLHVGMLFVDADNVAAVRLYDKLGFVVTRTDCLYEGAVR